ncbi:MAG: trypsin-like serine protease [Myxococcales bacterium]|nr:trypsin-like serine protease [Myxococcales bacterium]
MAERPRTVSLLLLALAAASLAGCELQLCPSEGASDAAEVVGTSDQAIIGGTVDTEHHATVALLFTMPDGGKGLCSGTIIAKQGDVGHVLTAAHCVQGVIDHVYEAVDWRDCAGWGDPARCRASYTPVSWQAHPDYDDSVYTDDFAVVTFTGATASTPVVPAASAGDGLGVGDPVVLSGYGRTYAGESNGSPTQSVRHQVAVTIASEGPAYLRFDASTGKTACFGDSGGPAYGVVSGAVRVVGVASTADANCQYVATYRRVADVYAEFIGPIVEGDDPCPACGGSDPGPEPGEGGHVSGDGGAGGDAAGGGGAGAAPAPDGGGGQSSSSPPPEGEEDACVPLKISCSAAEPGQATADWPVALLGLLALRRRARRTNEKRAPAHGG